MVLRYKNVLSMKKKSVIFVLCLIVVVFNWSRPARYAVQNYYLAAAGTDVGSCPITAPCKSLAYLNTITLTAQDSIFLNRGDSFPGEFIPTSGGSSSHVIWFGAYGTGVMPVVTGFYKAIGYANVGTNLWTFPLPSNSPNFINFVTYNGKKQGMGRTPNSGYDTVAATGTTYITDPSLTGTSFGTGELVLRTNHFTLTRNTITSQSGDTISYTAKNGPGVTNWGFFIQNNVNTLDTAGEWWYDSTAHLMHIYTTDTTIPVQVAVVDTLVNLTASGRQYITFDHINFQGGNDVIAQLLTVTNISFQNCNLKHSNTGLLGANVSNVRIVNDSIGSLNDLGAQFTSGGTDKIDSNYIYDIGTIPGMGVPVSAYEGLSLQITSSQMSWNKFYKIGYDPMNIKGTLDTANYNLIDSFDFVLDDGGGIYWYENLGFSDSGKRCIGNMIYNGIGATLGTSGGIPGEIGAIGIYTDQSSTGIEIDSNTCFNNSQANLLIHSSQNIGVEHNNFYNAAWTEIFIVHDNATYDKLRNLTIKNNTLGSNISVTQYTGVMIVFTTIDAVYDSVGTIDSNNYVTPDPTWWVGTSTGSSFLQTYSQWQTLTGTDGHSSFFTQPFGFYYNTSQSAPLPLPLPPPADYWLDLSGIHHVAFALPILQSAFLNPFQIITPLGNVSKKLRT
jgi:hypothetical protein